MESCKTCGGSTQDGISLLSPAYQHLNDFITNKKIGNLCTRRLCNGCLTEVSHWQKFVERWNFSQKKFHSILASNLVDCSSSRPGTQSRFQLRECKVVLERLNIFCCHFCNREFFTKPSLTHHIKSVHLKSRPKVPRFACAVCNIKYHDIKLLDHHVRTLHVENGQFKICKVGVKALKYRCGLCQKLYKKYRLDDHYRSAHSKFKPFACTLCGKKFFTMPLLLTHQISHSKTLIPCSKCDFKLRSKQSLRLHMRNVHENLTAQYKCFDCSAQFRFKENLKSHIMHVHNKEKVFCKMCGEEFISLSRLQLHKEKNHSKNPPVSCEVCEKSFRSLGCLNRHRVIHENRRFQCKFCDCQFSTQMNLNRHIQIQHSDNPPCFKCDQCSYTSRWKEAWQRHVTVVHGTQKQLLNCSLCNYKVKCEMYLRRHMKDVHGPKKYSCDLCKYKSTRVFCIRVHKQKIHKVSNS